jgi:hypothetical protein
MKKLAVFFLTLCALSEVFAQHLPLRIGNQWHYNAGLIGGVGNHVAIATDTTRINNKNYFRIENWSTDGSQLIFVTYDRMVWDSTYYRLSQDSVEYLLFNFKWPNNFIYSTQSTFDTSCVDLLLIYKYVGQIWGIYSDFYTVFFGFHCQGWQDTSWTLSSLSLAYSFGSINGFDGQLIGAVINGITYGTLHPLPVELLSFSSSVIDDDVTLSWTTATEINNSGFNIERKQVHSLQSIVGNEEWQTIGFVNGKGTTTEPQTYSFVDENLSADKYQYRLKQIDFDGTFEYSNVVEAVILPPAKFSLEQNFPNPFNPTTTIKYSIPEVATHRDASLSTTLKVFDVLGNEVATLVNEYKPAGKFEVEFNATTLASGIYYYQIKTGEFVQSKKMILLK